MKKPIEVVMLPTGLPILKGQLAILDGKTSIYSFDMKDEHPAEAQYAYVTVSQDVEPIKEGDWLYETDLNTINQAGKEYKSNDNDKKIIATTDPRLEYSVTGYTETRSRTFYEKLPQVPQSFIEEFVANPDGEFEIEYECQYHTSKEFYGKEAKWVTCDVQQFESIKESIPTCPLRYNLKLNQDNTVNITSVNKCLYDTPKSCENSECRVLNKCNGDRVTSVEEKMLEATEKEILDYEK
tara:strand:- start:205 stop:921 length:717 start_codon:yes stop_codon:yes gene_type:complete